MFLFLQFPGNHTFSNCWPIRMITDTSILYFNSEQHPSCVRAYIPEPYSKKTKFGGISCWQSNWACIKMANRALCWLIRYKPNQISEQKKRSVDQLGWLQRQNYHHNRPICHTDGVFSVAGSSSGLQSHSLRM